VSDFGKNLFAAEHAEVAEKDRVSEELLVVDFLCALCVLGGKCSFVHHLKDTAHQGRTPDPDHENYTAVMIHPSLSLRRPPPP
jgi:hypothetical protein